LTSPRAHDCGDTVPTISIVTPCLNARSTIERSLQSVAAQGYPGLEHVVIDGQSTDGTLDVLKSFESQGAITLVSEPDSGLAEALNKGVGIAGGDVLGLLNADDLYLPRSLDRVAAAFRANPGAWWVTVTLHRRRCR
jgi:glycosyltransferase involved in cell wall biosynthesis